MQAKEAFDFTQANAKECETIKFQNTQMWTVNWSVQQFWQHPNKLF